MKLRLLLTEYCDRGCKGCCNKDWNLDALPVVQGYHGYSEVLITGGEPLLRPNLLKKTIRDIRKQNPTAKIYVYTAMPFSFPLLFDILKIADGITLTLHDQTDANMAALATIHMPEHLKHSKSLRLNVFESIMYEADWFKEWKIKDNMVWIKNCPLPKDEIFMRLKARKGGQK